MKNKIILASLSMDLKRIALGQHRNSVKLSDKFSRESLIRINEVDRRNLKPYMQRILVLVKNDLEKTDGLQKAENCLMYSTLIQNYVLSNF